MADTEESDCVTCIGAGRLGLCWALCVEKAGFKVKAVDVFPTYVDAINARTLRSHEPKLVEMLQQSTQLTATLSISEGVHFSRYIYIFVQTPSSGSDRHYDHTHLNDVLSQLNALRVKDKHVIICCTVMPGYIDTIAPAILADCQNVTVSYSPEFIAQGAIIAGTLEPDMVLIGEGSKEAGDAIEQHTLRYVTNRPRICRMSPGGAEITKLSLNSFITLKIGMHTRRFAAAKPQARLPAHALSLFPCF
jgi:UDPglucose 6-dehydrogenase